MTVLATSGLAPVAGMSGQEAMLACYQAIADIAGRMVDAARSGDWQRLDDEEQRCEAWMRRVETLGEPSSVLDGDGRRRRVALLRETLRHDARLRELLEPWLPGVERCLGRSPAGR